MTKKCKVKIWRAGIGIVSRCHNYALKGKDYCNSHKGKKYLSPFRALLMPGIKKAMFRVYKIK